MSDIKGGNYPHNSSASAPAKILLCGEHSVVYGRPSIAIPLDGLSASVTIRESPPGSGITFDAREIGQSWELHSNPAHPLSKLVALYLSYLSVDSPPDIRIIINSHIPIASGMGSSAAVATALVRALANYMNCPLGFKELNDLVYQSECFYHGTPSGIDNTVIAYDQPIWFKRVHSPLNKENENTASKSRKDKETELVIEPLAVAQPFVLVIGDTGIRHSTKLSVEGVRQRRQQDERRYEGVFDQVATLVIQAREALRKGDLQGLGNILDNNQALLEEIGVSSPELDTLIKAARIAGALGAKLSGAGRGGVMIALATPETQEAIIRALTNAGAQETFPVLVGINRVDE